MNEKKEHHFLYYIFKADKKEHPMPDEKVQPLAQKIRKLFQKEKQV